jgi:hypothetical protein
VGHIGSHAIERDCSADPFEHMAVSPVMENARLQSGDTPGDYVAFDGMASAARWGRLQGYLA